MSVMMYIKSYSKFVAILISFLILIPKTRGEEAKSYGGITSQACALAEETRYAILERIIKKSFCVCVIFTF